MQQRIIDAYWAGIEQGRAARKGMPRYAEQAESLAFSEGWKQGRMEALRNEAIRPPTYATNITISTSSLYSQIVMLVLVTIMGALTLALVAKTLHPVPQPDRFVTAPASYQYDPVTGHTYYLTGKRRA